LGLEIWRQRIKAAEIRFLGGLKGVTLRDRQRSGDIKNLYVDKITDGIKEYRGSGEVTFTGC
jgi:hypothetical protein